MPPNSALSRCGGFASSGKASTNPERPDDKVSTGYLYRTVVQSPYIQPSVPSLPSFRPRPSTCRSLRVFFPPLSFPGYAPVASATTFCFVFLCYCPSLFATPSLSLSLWSCRRPVRQLPLLRIPIRRGFLLIAGSINCCVHGPLSSFYLLWPTPEPFPRLSFSLPTPLSRSPSSTPC